MARFDDAISKAALNIINKADEPLVTKEIQERVKKKVRGVTRTKLFYRLTMLRAEGKIKAKFVGSGKGAWIWWRADVFK